MPELAEVEFYRKVWDCGLKQKITAIQLHGEKRIFRGLNPAQLEKKLRGATLLDSRAHGKQMLFHFSGNAWLGIHLGMTGKLLANAPEFSPGKHDHLVLFQQKQTLVFYDPRQFGRIVFDESRDEPAWWKKLPPPLSSPAFSFPRTDAFLQSHRKAPIKSVLLLQDGFPGIGNWMADEILWQAKIYPHGACGNLDAAKRKMIFKKTRAVANAAMKTIGKDFSDPPKTWLFSHRWKRKSPCPRCAMPLKFSEIGGRTTCWCPACQKEKG